MPFYQVWAFSNGLQWTYAYTTQMGSLVFWEITLMSIFWTCLEVWTLHPYVNIPDASVYGYLVRILSSYIILVYQTLYLHW